MTATTNRKIMIPRTMAAMEPLDKVSTTAAVGSSTGGETGGA